MDNQDDSVQIGFQITVNIDTNDGTQLISTEKASPKGLPREVSPEDDQHQSRPKVDEDEKVEIAVDFNVEQEPPLNGGSVIDDNDTTPKNSSRSSTLTFSSSSSSPSTSDSEEKEPSNLNDAEEAKIQIATDMSIEYEPPVNVEQSDSKPSNIYENEIQNKTEDNLEQDLSATIDIETVGDKIVVNIKVPGDNDTNMLNGSQEPQVGEIYCQSVETGTEDPQMEMVADTISEQEPVPTSEEISSRPPIAKELQTEKKVDISNEVKPLAFTEVLPSTELESEEPQVEVIAEIAVEESPLPDIEAVQNVENPSLTSSSSESSESSESEEEVASKPDSIKEVEIEPAVDTTIEQEPLKETTEPDNTEELIPRSTTEEAGALQNKDADKKEPEAELAPETSSEERPLLSFEMEKNMENLSLTPSSSESSESEEEETSKPDGMREGEMQFVIKTDAEQEPLKEVEKSEAIEELAPKNETVEVEEFPSKELVREEPPVEVAEDIVVEQGPVSDLHVLKDLEIPSSLSPASESSESSDSSSSESEDEETFKTDSIKEPGIHMVVDVPVELEPPGEPGNPENSEEITPKNMTVDVEILPSIEVSSEEPLKKTMVDRYQESVPDFEVQKFTENRSSASRSSSSSSSESEEEKEASKQDNVEGAEIDVVFDKPVEQEQSEETRKLGTTEEPTSHFMEIDAEVQQSKEVHNEEPVTETKIDNFVKHEPFPCFEVPENAEIPSLTSSSSHSSSSSSEAEEEETEKPGDIEGAGIQTFVDIPVEKEPQIMPIEVEGLPSNEMHGEEPPVEMITNVLVEQEPLIDFKITKCAGNPTSKSASSSSSSESSSESEDEEMSKTGSIKAAEIQKAVDTAVEQEPPDEAEKPETCEELTPRSIITVDLETLPNTEVDREEPPIEKATAVTGDTVNVVIRHISEGDVSTNIGPEYTIEIPRSFGTANVVTANPLDDNLDNFVIIETKEEEISNEEPQPQITINATKLTEEELPIKEIDAEKLETKILLENSTDDFVREEPPIELTTDIVVEQEPLSDFENEKAPGIPPFTSPLLHSSSSSSSESGEGDISEPTSMRKAEIETLVDIPVEYLLSEETAEQEITEQFTPHNTTVEFEMKPDKEIVIEEPQVEITKNIVVDQDPLLDLELQKEPRRPSPASSSSSSSESEDEETSQIESMKEAEIQMVIDTAVEKEPLVELENPETTEELTSQIMPIEVEQLPSTVMNSEEIPIEKTTNIFVEQEPLPDFKIINSADNQLSKSSSSSSSSESSSESEDEEMRNTGSIKEPKIQMAVDTAVEQEPPDETENQETCEELTPWSITVDLEKQPNTEVNREEPPVEKATDFVVQQDFEITKSNDNLSSKSSSSSSSSSSSESSSESEDEETRTTVVEEPSPEITATIDVQQGRLPDNEFTVDVDNLVTEEPSSKPADEEEQPQIQSTEYVVEPIFLPTTDTNVVVDLAVAKEEEEVHLEAPDGISLAELDQSDDEVMVPETDNNDLPVKDIPTDGSHEFCILIAQGLQDKIDKLSEKNVDLKKDVKSLKDDNKQLSEKLVELDDLREENTFLKNTNEYNLLQVDKQKDFVEQILDNEIQLRESNEALQKQVAELQGKIDKLKNKRRSAVLKEPLPEPDYEQANETDGPPDSVQDKDIKIEEEIPRGIEDAKNNEFALFVKCGELEIDNKNLNSALEQSNKRIEQLQASLNAAKQREEHMLKVHDELREEMASIESQLSSVKGGKEPLKTVEENNNSNDEPQISVQVINAEANADVIIPIARSQTLPSSFAKKGDKKGEKKSKRLSLFKRR